MPMIVRPFVITGLPSLQEAAVLMAAARRGRNERLVDKRRA